MSASGNFKYDSIREKFGAHPRDVRSSERNPIELVPSSEKYFIFLQMRRHGGAKSR
jgi:hypothetical protein